MRKETRVTDPNSGAQKGKKIERYSLIPPAAMDEVAAVYGRGAEKYATRNWEGGYSWNLSIDALERHIAEFKKGNIRDELGNHHLGCAVFHCLALMTFEKFGLGTDDRSKLGRNDENRS